MSNHCPGPDHGFPHGDARLDITGLCAFPKPGDLGNARPPKRMLRNFL
jgi:hypothetical protein